MVKKTIENTLKKEHYPTDVKRLTEVYQHQEKRRCENIVDIIKKTKEKCESGNGEEKEKCFRGICRKHADVLYPKIGEQAYAVPPFQIHSSKTSETTVGTSRILQSSESESDFRGLTGQRTVGQRFRALNRTFEKSSREKCMFIIIDYVMDNFMRRFYKTNSKTSRPSLEDFFKDSKTGKCWVGCPDDSDEETKSAGTRSNQDLIVLHEDKGLLFVQIKSVQKNKTTTDEAVVKSIKDGQKQLLQDVSVLKKCLRKSTPQSVTKVLALPNLRKQQLDSIKQIKGLVGKDIKLLLADHLSGDEDFGVWWEELDKKRLDSDQIKEIVGRYLGLFSTPQQLQAVNERHHVRDHCDALLFTGRLFKRLIFTEEQIEILRRHLGDNKKNVYISGPPGSGKTLMLIQRSKLFLNSDSNMVIVLDAYRGRKGRAVGEFIVQTLEKCYETDSNVRRKVKHLPLDISDKDDCQHQLKKFKKRVNVMFIIDEMFSHPNWESILQALHEQSHCFWCAGIDPEFPFKGIKCTTEELTSILRCPPSVKKVLSQVDWEKSRRSQGRCYNSESEVTERGTEGPIPLCIRHEKHVNYSEQKPIDCPECAEELVDIFRKKLKLIHTEKSSTVRLPCSIVILYNIPRNEYQNTESGQVEITKTNFDKYSKTLSECTFLGKLQENLQNVEVHTVLNFEEGFMKGHKWDEILFTWVDTFQGLERDIVVYLPGDGKIPRSETKTGERPVPGVRKTPKESDTGKKSQASTSQHHSLHVEPSPREKMRKRKSPSPSSRGHPKVSKHDHRALEPETTRQSHKSEVKQPPTKQIETSDRWMRNRVPSPKRHPSSQAFRHGPGLETEPEPQPSTSQERVQSRKPQDRPETSDRQLRKRGPGSPGDQQEPKPKKHRPESEIEPQSQASTSQNHSVRHGLGKASMMFDDDDIQRYSQWDQTNLFLAASRCCAQLIMIVP